MSIKDLHLNDSCAEANQYKVLHCQQTMMGDPSIDRPWLSYYTEEAKKQTIPEKTIYQYLKEKSSSHLLSPALNYFDRVVRYGELLDSVDMAAKSFKQAGVTEGDIVTICAPTIPETIYSIYALNKIGAIANLIDPRNNASRIQEQINQTKSKILVMIDLCYPKIKNIIQETSIEQAISISCADSLPFGLNFSYRAQEFIKSLMNHIPRIPNDSIYTKWSQFLRLGRQVTKEINTKYVPNTPAAIVYTSGTLGMAKGAVLSNENLNAMSLQYDYSGVPHKVGDRFLDVMPAFLAYGLVNGIHMPLTLGMENILIPQIKVSKVNHLVTKYHPQVLMGTPEHYEPFFELPADKDLSCITSPGVGGASLDADFEKKINDTLALHKCSSKIAKGYGLTEMSSAAIVCLSNEMNEIGGVGIPLLFTNIMIRDPKTKEKLSYNQEGEIWLSGPTLMLGYYDSPEKTNSVIEIIDGERWFQTGDLGKIDELGRVDVFGRMTQKITLPDGHKVSAKELKSLLKKHPIVKDCEVVGVKDPHSNRGERPKACIELKTNQSSEAQAFELLDEYCYSNLPERDVPAYYEFFDSIPHNLMGKAIIGELTASGIENAFHTKTEVTKIGIDLDSFSFPIKQKKKKLK